MYLSPSRTKGGFGGGPGIRRALGDRYFFQVDAGYLFAIGNVVDLRVGFGVERRGLYRPAIIATAAALFGSQLSFSTASHLAPVSSPALTIGAVLAPVRFVTDRTQLALLQAGYSVGSDLPGIAKAYRLDLLEIGFSF